MTLKQGDQEQVNNYWADKTSRSKGKNPHSPCPQVLINAKACTKMSTIIIIVKQGLVNQREKSCAVTFECTCHNCAKEGHVARKCLKKPKT